MCIRDRYKPSEQALFMEIADYFAAAAPQVSDADEKLVVRLIEADLSERYPCLLYTSRPTGTSPRITMAHPPAAI